jgi:hypothetical protein
VDGCRRSLSSLTETRPFPRRDKRKDHVLKVHKDLVIDLEAFDHAIAGLTTSSPPDIYSSAPNFEASLAEMTDKFNLDNLSNFDTSAATVYTDNTGIQHTESVPETLAMPPEDLFSASSSAFQWFGPDPQFSAHPVLAHQTHFDRPTSTMCRSCGSTSTNTTSTAIETLPGGPQSITMDQGNTLLDIGYASSNHGNSAMFCEPTVNDIDGNIMFSNEAFEDWAWFEEAFGNSGWYDGGM